MIAFHDRPDRGGSPSLSKAAVICSYAPLPSWSPETGFQPEPRRAIVNPGFDWVSCWRKRRPFHIVEMRNMDMSIKKTFISAGLLTPTVFFVISQPLHHAVGDELHFEERSDTSMAAATPRVSVSISGDLQYRDRVAKDELPSDPRLIATANTILQRWFEGAKSQSPTAVRSQPRFTRASMANMVPQSRLRSSQSRKCYSASSGRRL
jgi:hypothetical protein